MALDVSESLGFKLLDGRVQRVRGTGREVKRPDALVRRA
jgi:hypothetical protein